MYIVPIICFQNFGTVISPTILIFRFCSKEALKVTMAQVPSTSSSIAAQKTVGHRTIIAIKAEKRGHYIINVPDSAISSLRLT